MLYNNTYNVKGFQNSREQVNTLNIVFGYTIEKEPKHYINELIIDTKKAIRYLDTKIQNIFRHLAARNTGGKESLGRPRRRWVDNIRMDLQEVGCGYTDWIGLAQDRDGWWTLVGAVMNLWVP